MFLCTPNNSFCLHSHFSSFSESNLFHTMHIIFDVKKTVAQSVITGSNLSPALYTVLLHVEFVCCISVHVFLLVETHSAHITRLSCLYPYLKF